MQAQQPVRDTVEGADPQRRGWQLELGLDARAHLARALLVKVTRRRMPCRRDALDLAPARHAVREHARLAAAGRREHERVAASGAS